MANVEQREERQVGSEVGVLSGPVQTELCLGVWIFLCVQGFLETSEAAGPERVGASEALQIAWYD